MKGVQLARWRKMVSDKSPYHSKWRRRGFECNRLVTTLEESPTGNLIALDGEVLHDVEALGDSAFILIICSSEAEKPRKLRFHAQKLCKIERPYERRRA